jgi:hypothetical protein
VPEFVAAYDQVRLIGPQPNGALMSQEDSDKIDTPTKVFLLKQLDKYGWVNRSVPLAALRLVTGAYALRKIDGFDGPSLRLALTSSIDCFRASHLVWKVIDDLGNANG